jgi:bromodomain-containing factor 1
VNPVVHSGRDGLPEAERNEYRRLVQLIIRTHKTASQPFLFPVPESVIGYYDVIKKPVDLTTIRQRLDSCSYLNRGEFEQDFLQMILNAYIFNPPNSEVFKAAVELHQALVMGLQKSVIALNDLKRQEGYAEIEAARRKRQQLVRRVSSTDWANNNKSVRQPSIMKKSTTEEELRRKLEYLQKVVSKQQSSSRKPSPSPAPQERPLSDRQLDQLADDLEQLDPRHVPQVANVLKGEPTARIADGQLDLSIHDLPPAKQRELLRLMEKIKAQDKLRERMGERVNDYSDDEDPTTKRLRI